jgi:hypothetical protein
MKTFLDWAPEFKASVGVEPRLNHVIASIINQSKFSLIFNEKETEKKQKTNKKYNSKQFFYVDHASLSCCLDRQFFKNKQTQ